MECDGWFVFGYENGGSKHYDGEEIEEFVKREFGGCRIDDLSAFQLSLELKINEAFEGRRRVHVVKGESHYNHSIWGVGVTIDRCRCVIMRVA
jgi:hypothetical protein